MVRLFMVGARIKPGRVSMPVQLSDLYPSMGHLLSDGPYCLGENRRSLLRASATPGQMRLPPECAAARVYRSGLRRWLGHDPGERCRYALCVGFRTVGVSQGIGA